MFSKKQKEQPKQLDYTNWEKDLGFLTLILTRKKNITKEFLINVYSSQKAETDYLNDSEIEPVVNAIVEETIEQLGEKYKEFIIDKYFGTKENLIKFITEDVYVDLTSDAISRNNKKINTNIQKRIIKNLNNQKKS